MIAATQADLLAWGELLAQAERCAAKPTLNTEALERALRHAGKAVVPAGELTRANPFIALLDVAQRFTHETMLGRCAAVPELLAAIAAADAARRVERTDPAPAVEPEPPPVLPFRRDIDG